VFFVAFATFITAAVYISPMYCGSQNEKKMVNGPQEIAMESKWILLEDGAMFFVQTDTLVVLHRLPTLRSWQPCSRWKQPWSQQGPW
jgi:hypothetical protein